MTDFLFSPKKEKIRFVFPVNKSGCGRKDSFLCSVLQINDCPQGRTQDFKLGGGGIALKKIPPSGGRRENLWSISCEKSRFYAKKSNFFQCWPPPPGPFFFWSYCPPLRFSGDLQTFEAKASMQLYMVRPYTV